MKKLTGASVLADRFALPEFGVRSARVTVTDARRVLVESHRGILAYGKEHIALASSRGQLHVYGSELTLEAMSADTLVVNGKISSVEFDRV